MQHSRVIVGLAMAFAIGAASLQTALAKRIEPTDEPPKLSSKEPKELWVIAQRTDGLKNYTVCVSKNAVKFVNGRLSVISSQPDWQVAIVNEDAKTYWQMPMKDFHGLVRMETFDSKKLDRTEPTDKQDPDEKIANRLVVVQSGVPEFSADKIKKLGSAPTKVMVWSSSDIALAPEALEFFARLYKLDGLAGIPLRVRMKPQKGEDIECLTTDWCLNREQPSGFFNIPKHFRKGKDQLAVESEDAVITHRSMLKKPSKKGIRSKDATAEKDQSASKTDKPASKKTQSE